MTAGLALAGCSSLPSDLDMSDLDPTATGSIPASSRSTSEPTPKGVASDDWAAARLALNEALGEATSPSVPWENHASATRGTVTPFGATATAGRGTCREFLMSFVRAQDTAWLQGEACRKSQGAAWQVDQARLLQST